MGYLGFDAPEWLASLAAGPGRPWLVAAVAAAVLADHRHLRRLARGRVPSRRPPP